jgi:Meckel syndrome type 1 protein
MNTRPPATDPLDPQEREFQRVLRALPGGDPPPALDAAILRAAHDALARPRHRRALFAASNAAAWWGVGSAAAAILVVGIGYRQLVPTMQPPPEPRAVTVAADSDSDKESTTVEFIPARPLASAPPPPMEQQAAPAAAAAPQRRVELPEDKVAAAPATATATDMPEPFIDEHVAGGRSAEERERANATTELAATQAERGQLRSDMTRSRQEAAKAAAPPSAPAPAPATAGALADAMSETTVGSASAEKDAGLANAQANESAAQARDRVLLDLRRAPDAWVLKIRQRLREGDLAGARASLKLYIERYPQRPVPEDLRPLLHE